MREIFDTIMFNYYFAVAAIIFGFWKLRDTIKNTPVCSHLSLQPFLSGIAGSIGSVFLGIIIIYYKIKGVI